MQQNQKRVNLRGQQQEEKNSKTAFILPAFIPEKKEMRAFGLRFLTTLKRHMIKRT